MSEEKGNEEQKENKDEKSTEKDCMFPRKPRPCEDGGFIAAIVSGFMAGVAATIGIMRWLSKD